jgi:ABC-2 type transport system permease protein
VTARILDRGYRRYRGPRTGVRGAVLTLFKHSVQRGLGMRRTPWAKVLPILSIAIAYVPAIVFIGVISLVPDAKTTGLVLPTYGEYFFYIQSAVALFVAFVAPELMCTDRRTGMLGVYLASPLTRDSYLVAKAWATAAMLSFITAGPPLLMLVAFILQENGPNGPAGVASTLLKVLLTGLTITVLFTSVSMAVSSITDRKAFATAGLILTLLVTSSAVGVMRGALRLSDNLIAFDLLQLPLAMAEKIHGGRHFTGVSPGAVVFGALGWTLAGAIVTRTRYQKLQVTK